MESYFSNRPGPGRYYKIVFFEFWASRFGGSACVCVCVCVGLSGRGLVVRWGSGVSACVWACPGVGWWSCGVLALLGRWGSDALACVWACRGVGVWGRGALPESILEETFQIASGTGRQKELLDEVLVDEIWRCT